VNTDFSLAVHCILLLEAEGGTLLSSSAIAERASVHPVRVRRVLGLLKAGGYIGSKEGAQGGFSLAVPLERIPLSEIYMITNQDALKSKCHECSESCRFGARLERTLESLFDEADERLLSFLGTYSLRDVADKVGPLRGKGC
jgi:Rrf2 family protein